MKAKPVDMTFGLVADKKKARFYVPDGEGKRYATDSIVSAREYAVKMIEKHPMASMWAIYTSASMTAKPHSGVVFYGTPAGYGWLYKSAAPKVIYKNGKLKTKEDKYRGDL